MYDAGVRYTDHLVGEVVDQWRQSGRLDNTVVIVLGDHGEAMGEHRAFGHVSPVNEVDLRVPLVMRYPARIPAGSVVEQAVSTMGMFASILDMTGVDYPGTLQMDTLLPGIHGEVVGQPVMAERFEEEMLAGRFAPGTANGEGPLVNPRGRYRTFRSGPWKLVQHSEDGNFLYNLEEDPGELRELAQENPEQLETLIRDLALFQSMLGLPDLDAPVDAPRVPPDLDEGTVEALRSLGYVE
jgi:arylsulfatase A-like enzyme